MESMEPVLEQLSTGMELAEIAALARAIPTVIMAGDHDVALILTRLMTVRQVALLAANQQQGEEEKPRVVGFQRQ